MERYILVTILFVFSFSYTQCVQTVNGIVKITMGITAGDTEVENFIRNQLVPTYNEYRDLVDIEFVPWGRTERHDNGTVTCDFGELGCWANRLHRCVQNHLKGNVQAILDYMTCEYTEPYPAFTQRSYSCAREAGMRIFDVDYCVNNPSLDTLDQEAEDSASQALAEIGTVPYIVFNDHANAAESAQGVARLSSVVCFALADDAQSGVNRCQI